MQTRFTAVYWDWLDSIEDSVTRARIQFGPGYRVYYTERKAELAVLCGGDKSSQPRDIQKAIALARRL
jgi:putative addiction module killer protein